MRGKEIFSMLKREQIDAVAQAESNSRSLQTAQCAQLSLVAVLSVSFDVAHEFHASSYSTSYVRHGGKPNAYPTRESLCLLITDERVFS